MDLPSLADILVVIVYLVPGFVAFQVIKKIAFIEKEFTEFELTVWSVFGSLCIYLVFSLLFGVSSLEKVRESVFDGKQLLSLIVISLLGGVITGISGKYLFRKGFFPGDCWEFAFDQIKTKGSYVLVYTLDGREFKGMAEHYDSGEDEHQIILARPKLILRNDKWKIVDEIEMGQRILLDKNQIKQLVFL